MHWFSCSCPLTARSEVVSGYIFWLTFPFVIINNWSRVVEFNEMLKENVWCYILILVTKAVDVSLHYWKKYNEMLLFPLSKRMLIVYAAWVSSGMAVLFSREPFNLVQSELWSERETRGEWRDRNWRDPGNEFEHLCAAVLSSSTCIHVIGLFKRPKQWLKLSLKRCQIKKNEILILSRVWGKEKYEKLCT